MYVYNIKLEHFSFFEHLFYVEISLVASRGNHVAHDNNFTNMMHCGICVWVNTVLSVSTDKMQIKRLRFWLLEK